MIRENSTRPQDASPETASVRPVYTFQYLGVEIPDRPWRERSAFLIALIGSVAELCERDLIAIPDIETFRTGARAEVEFLGGESWAHGGDRSLQRSLEALDQSLSLRAKDPSPHAGKARTTVNDWLRWRQHIDRARWLCEQSVLSWRAELKNGTIPEHERVRGCVETMEGLVPILRSACFEDGLAQAKAAGKVALLNAQLISEAGEAKMAAQFAAAVVHQEKYWAAFIEALATTNWQNADDPRGYLLTVTGTIYSGQVQPDSAGLDTQGFMHKAGSGQKIKRGDAMCRLTELSRVQGHAYIDDDDSRQVIRLEELTATPVEASYGRRYSSKSVEELRRAAEDDADLAAYVKAIVHNPKWKRSDLWRSLGWDADRGRSVDRKYRRLRQRLKDEGAGMSWREILVPAAASQTVFLETLLDGARGRGLSVWQHKSLEMLEK